MKAKQMAQQHGTTVARAVLAAAISAAMMTSNWGATSVLADVGYAPNTPGAVVSVAGTPFLWVADEQGVLHLVGDTRSLGGHSVDWSNTAQLSLDQLRGSSRGDPWLSAPMVKIGDAFFVPRYAAGATNPTLYHVQSPADLSLIGLSGQNYGALVKDRFAWEQALGMSTDGLPRAELPSVVAAPAPAPAPTPAPAATAAPASATMTSPTTTTVPTTDTSAAAANATMGSLNHVPTFGSGGDVNFTLLEGRGWTDAMSVTGLNDVMPVGSLDGESTIARWRTLDGSGRPYYYLEVKATNLSTHPDVKTARNLADVKIRFLCRDVDSCSTANGADAVFGGVSAAYVDGTFTRKFGAMRNISGLATDQGDQNADQLTWNERDVFLVKGNYGFDVRLLSTNSLSGRLDDLDKMLATLKLNY